MVKSALYMFFVITAIGCKQVSNEKEAKFDTSDRSSSVFKYFNAIETYKSYSLILNETLDSDTSTISTEIDYIIQSIDSVTSITLKKHGLEEITRDNYSYEKIPQECWDRVSVYNELTSSEKSLIPAVYELLNDLYTLLRKKDVDELVLFQINPESFICNGEKLHWENKFHNMNLFEVLSVMEELKFELLRLKLVIIKCTKHNNT